MTIFLDRIDSVPLQGVDFSFQFESWLAVLVDSLNENISDIQNAFNLLTAPNYTAAEISDLLADGLLADGIFLYDTDNDVYVGMENGALVKFTTTPYP
jgi:hypothetical protein